MDISNIPEKPLRPAEYTERRLLERILDSTYKPGQALPAERILASSLGVTRPTLRETLQRLAREGWVTIQHGKSTIVNDYLFQGGLGVLGTLAKLGKGLSCEMISHLLQVRSFMLPGIALLAVKKDPESLLRYLEKSEGLKDDPKEFAVFDWGLQSLMAKTAANPVFMMILNDFTPLSEIFGEIYFGEKAAREFSRQYYQELMTGITRKERTIRELVQTTMEHSEKLWQENNEIN